MLNQMYETATDTVAPLAGAWIEILDKWNRGGKMDRRSPRGSVD